jgi:hypothetical protein
MRHVAAVAVAALVLLTGTPRAAADTHPVTYRPPVDAPVTDGFRPPASDYGAGNLGLDYSTVPGSPVRAAAPGEVTFAGQVGGTLHVVVLHADGIRTSYSFLATIDVVRGQSVAAGERVGATAGEFHFGARAGDAYVDPAILLGSSSVRVHLVPDDARRPASEAAERSNVQRLLGLLGRAGRGTATAATAAVGVGAAVGAEAVDWARDGAVAVATKAAAEVRQQIEQLRLIVHYARSVLIPAYLDDLLVTLRTAAAWRRQQASCTPEAQSPGVVAEHRLVVEVAGLGSHQSRRPTDPTTGGAVFEVDTGALYADADIYRFSYRGGTTEERGYTSADTQVDIRESGRRLRELLERLQFEHPGVPIDLIAHSQGGLVVRSALGDELDRLDPRTPRIAHVVTLGTPHHGANLATAGVLLGQTGIGDSVEKVAGAAHLGGIDPKSTSVRQLAETSSFIRELNRRPPPDGVRFTSIAARGDPVVPSPRAHLGGATNVIVDVPGAGADHDHLPGSTAATREIGLAVNDLGPTCQSLIDAVGDALYGAAISRTEDQVAVLATFFAAKGHEALAAPTTPKRSLP